MAACIRDSISFCRIREPIECLSRVMSCEYLSTGSVGMSSDWQRSHEYKYSLSLIVMSMSTSDLSVIILKYMSTTLIVKGPGYIMYHVWAVVGHNDYCIPLLFP